MKLIRKNKKGFTLVELIVVIAILAVLALILVPTISNYVNKATDAKNDANAKALYNQAVLEVATWEGTFDEADIEGKLSVEGTGTVKVNLSLSGDELESIEYTPTGGSKITWGKNGKVE